MHPVFRDICNTIAPKVDIDFLVTGGRSILLLTPLSKEGKDWCEEHLDVALDTGSISVMQDEIANVVRDITSDGLKVRWQYL